jgi:hypothetical protein
MHDIIVQYAKSRPAYVLRKWKHRGHVPHQHRLPILMEAAKRGVEIKPSDFVFPKDAKKAKRGRKRKAA